MVELAKQKLITSKGVVLTGEELPRGIPADELKAIAEAGGIDAPQRLGKIAAKARLEDIQRADKALAEARDLFEAATTDEDRATAQRLVDEASAARAALE